MIGVIVPVHNEAATLARCLAAIATAARAPGLNGEAVRIYVVLDACTDDSARIAREAGAGTLLLDAKSVGRARAAGAERAIAEGAAWLAFTDGDSVVAPDWLAEQRAVTADVGAEAVCGTVQVVDWTDHSHVVRGRYDAHYNDSEGHRHVHGANLGVSVRAYREAGGIPPLTQDEDVAFVAALAARGCRIAWSARPRVITSARLNNRVAQGFAGFLRTLQAELVGP